MRRSTVPRCPLPDRRQLVDSFFPILSDFDDRINELEDQVFGKASDKQVQEKFALKRLVVGMRKAVSPQRNAFAGLMGGVGEAARAGGGDERYFRDVYDHFRVTVRTVR
jgi:magnesium transporter